MENCNHFGSATGNAVGLLTHVSFLFVREVDGEVVLVDYPVLVHKKLEELFLRPVFLMEMHPPVVDMGFSLQGLLIRIQI